MMAETQEVKAMGATSAERERRLANILETPGGANAVRSQSTADAQVERYLTAKMVELLDFILPHIKQIQERQSIEEHAMTLLEEMVQALR